VWRKKRNRFSHRLRRTLLTRSVRLGFSMPASSALDGIRARDVPSCATRRALTRIEMSHDRTKTEGGAWVWATEHRAPETASTQQLVGWLARGELPPHTLVWRPGWGEWLPAMQVAELAHAFPSVTPGSRRLARAASDGSVTPPPVPVAEYPRLRLLAKDVVGESAVAPFTGASQGLAPAVAARRLLRDLDHVQRDLVTSQVPAAAMLEAARAMKRQGSPVPPGRAEHLGRLDLGTFGDQSLPASAQSSGGESSSTPRRTLSPHALELVFPEPVEPELADSPWPPARRYGRWLSLGALVGAGLGLLAVRGPSPEAVAPALSGVERPPAPPEPSETRVVTGACRPLQGAVRLDEQALRDVPPTAAYLAGGVTVEEADPGTDVSVAAGWVAVGYARNHETAVGLALSPESLELQRLVTRRTPRPIFSVSPIVQDGGLAFHAEREGQSKLTWEPPRSSNARFGRPALATGGGTTALAVASRAPDGSRQSLWLSHAVEGEPPRVLQPFEPLPDEPIGGGGPDLDAPAIAALPGGGFGLLFTQGQGWKRRVRLQRLSSTLAPLGAPVDITTPDRALRGASVGALYWLEDRLLAFHFIGRDGGSSLWVSNIECELGESRTGS
jgi:hypothetical protein